MTDTNDLFSKLEKLSLEKLLNLCALALKEKMGKRSLEMLLLMLETRLKEYRTLSQLGIRPE
jgi:hypothetical protein